MTLSCKKIEDVVIIMLSGKISVDYTDFENSLYSYAGDSTKVIINCYDLTYINSFGLRSLLRVIKTLSSNGCKVVFCTLPDKTKDFFLITGFMQLFEVYETEDEALKSFVSDIVE
jgi:anti-anti-sigma factor